MGNFEFFTKGAGGGDVMQRHRSLNIKEKTDKSCEIE